jgi:tRNA threonylcarbamoyladenosine biosynthesis protein TsaB
MKLLAFDTSTQWLTVACGDGATWNVHGEPAGQAHSARLVPAIEAMLAACGWSLHDLDGIAFGAGPGSFTGVRITCGVAQGLALGAALPLVPVSTLEALAQQAWRTHGTTRVIACLDARMREVYIAAYERVDDGWLERRAPAVLKPDAVTVVESTGWHGVGDGFATYPALTERLRLASTDAQAVPDARAIAELALPRLRAGEGVDSADALPLYVRHRVALTTIEREAGVRL